MAWLGAFYCRFWSKIVIFVITMRGGAENLTTRIAKIPMAMALIPFALGIFFVDGYEVPLWLMIISCVASLAGAILLKKWWQMLALALLFCSSGALLHSTSFRGEIPYNKPLEMELKVERSSVERDGYTSAEAIIERCEEASLADCKVALWGDSLTHFKAGDRVRLTTKIRPFRTEREQYAKLMHHRGFVGSVSINYSTDYEITPTDNGTLHDWAVKRLQSSISEGDGRAVVLAMVTGERSEIGDNLRQNYSSSGASHLLAVSGLHIGIAFMLINLLLLPLILLPYGNLWRSIVAIAMIWLYVWLCGTSPSAIRAAIMFSMLQFALSSLREYVSINILAGTAFVMLAFDSHLLFDISFQLSFIAVAAIIVWAAPMYRLCATRFRVVNLLLGVLFVGIASTLATMPLVAKSFATISLVGILINPIVLLLANIVVLAGVLALALPFMGCVAEQAAEWQNGVVEWAASLPYGHFDATIPEWVMWIAYALYAVATIIFWSASKEKKEPKIEG